MNNTVVVPTNNVEGNVTSCKIETAKIRVDKNAPWSMVQYTSFRSYDVCTKEVIDNYTLPGVTPFASFSGFAVAVFLIAIIFSLGSSDPYGF